MRRAEYSPEIVQPEKSRQKQEKLKRVLKAARNLTLGISILSGLDSGIAVQSTFAQSLKVRYYRGETEYTPSQEARTKRLRELYGDNIDLFESIVAISRINPDGTTGDLIHKTRSVVERVERDETQPRVEALGGKDGVLTPELLTKVLSTYPKNWFTHEVGLIEQREDSKYEESEMLRKNKLGKVAGVADYSEDLVSIRFTKLTHKLKVSELVRILGHESAHANDFQGDNDLSIDEMLDLASSVGQRINDNDRYKSYYVEHIKDEDKQHQNYVRATEYWAEICEQYFADATKLNIKDALLVETAIKRNDPTFNWREAAEQRQELIKRATRK